MTGSRARVLRADGLLPSCLPTNLLTYPPAYLPTCLQGVRRARVLRADGFEAELPPLLLLERVDSLALLRAVTVNPCAASRVFDPDALCAQNEFLGYVALWLLVEGERPNHHPHPRRSSSSPQPAPIIRAPTLDLF